MKSVELLTGCKVAHNKTPFIYMYIYIFCDTYIIVDKMIIFVFETKDKIYVTHTLQTKLCKLYLHAYTWAFTVS